MNDPVVEIARSYSFKVPIARYSSIDLFCSEKASCNLSEAAEMSGKLYAFCKGQVMDAVREIEQEYDLDLSPRSRPAQVKEPEQQNKEPEQQMKLAEPTTLQEIAAQRETPFDPKEHVEQMRDDIYRITQCSKANIHDFFMGWFGATDGRQLPRKPEAFIDPLRFLLATVEGPDGHDGSKPWASLISNPRETGLTLKGVADFKPQSNGIGECEHGVTDGAGCMVCDTDGAAESQGYTATDEDVFDKDPVCERFGWKSMQTAAIARAWMTDSKKTLDEFADYLKYLNMLKLNENDLQLVLVMLYHDMDSGFKLWKKADAMGVELESVGGMLKATLSKDLRLDTPKLDAVKSMNTVFATLCGSAITV